MPEKKEKKPVDEEVRKAKAVKESSKEEESEETSDEEAEDEDEADDEGDEEAGAEGEDEEEEEVEAKPAGERDASTKGVAKALGVDADEEEEEAEADEKDAKLNRAQRRREEAVRRRAAREGSAKKSETEKAVAAKDADEKLPKDKNARAKELLRRRQESASGKRVTKLDAAEMVQDSLARASSATTGWIRNHLGLVVGVLVLGVGGAVGYTVWSNHKESVSAAASDQLEKGLSASLGYVSAKGDSRSDDDKKADPTPVFATLDARAEAQLAAYKVVEQKHDGTGPAILAKLGEGTAYLDKSQWDDAVSAYSTVLGSPLASADSDVKARALEGLGFAKEGKGDIDGATATYKDLEAVKGYEDLGKYHQARMLLKKGETDQAKEMFVTLQKKLEVPTLEGAESSYVKEAVNDYLKRIDPTLVKKPPTMGGLHGNTFTPDDLKDLDAVKMRKLQEMLKRQQQQEGDHHGMPMPGDHP